MQLDDERNRLTHPYHRRNRAQHRGCAKDDGEDEDADGVAVAFAEHSAARGAHEEPGDGDEAAGARERRVPADGDAAPAKPPGGDGKRERAQQQPEDGARAPIEGCGPPARLLDEIEKAGVER
jgi:hypothetical protein